MSIKEEFEIRPIDKKLAQTVVVQNHYLHRKASCHHAFGLFHRMTNDLVGVILYGIPHSPTLRRGLCGPEEANSVYELTRLWVKDGQPKNCESYLIANTVQFLDKDILVSFADSSEGHLGTVYQAVGWLYCGLSAKFIDPRLRSNPNLHPSTFAKGMTKAQILQKYGDNVFWVERSRKHRYIYINARYQRRRKELLSKLRYSTLPYPKRQIAQLAAA